MSIFSDAVHQTCGSSYCPSPINENVAKLTNITSLANNFEVASDISTTYLIASIYLGISLLSGVLMALFLDPPSKFEETKVEKNKSKQKISGKRLLAATFHQMTNWKQILITPLSFWVGFELGFFVSDFTVVSMIICIYFDG